MRIDLPVRGPESFTLKTSNVIGVHGSSSDSTTRRGVERTTADMAGIPRDAGRARQVTVPSTTSQLLSETQPQGGPRFLRFSSPCHPRRDLTRRTHRRGG